MRRDYQSKMEIKKSLKRYGICLLLSLPILLLVGFFMRNVNKTARMFVFVLLLMAIFLVCELFFRAKDQKKKDEKPKKDVFK